MRSYNVSAITIAAAQFDIRIFDKERNLREMMRLTETAVREHQADIVLFPEAAVSGYCFANPEECRQAAIRQSGAEIAQLQQLCRRLQVAILFGAVEEDEEGCIRNTAFWLDAEGHSFRYRKSHLPFLGLDRFVKPGEDLSVLNTPFGKIGLLICYDLRFPEPMRVLALQGARLVLQPTNLPRGGESHMDFFGRARACENRVYFVSCNRCGDERGFHFFGRSQIIDYTGKVLAEAGEAPEIISATLDLTLPKQKSIINIPGEYEMHVFQDRRPLLYAPLADATLPAEASAFDLP